MRKCTGIVFCMSLIMMSNISFSQNNWRVKNTELAGHWQIQSSDKVKANDEEISTLKFHPQNWYAAKVPNSTLGSLVDAGVFKNIFYKLLFVFEIRQVQYFYFAKIYRLAFTLQSDETTA